MSLTPNYSTLTKEQTFSSVAKGSAHIPIALDGSYPAGGYSIDSALLFNQDGFTFHMVNGYACNAARNSFLGVVHDVANAKLQVFNTSTGAEIAGGVDLSAYTAYCTFHRW